VAGVVDDVVEREPGVHRDAGGASVEGLARALGVTPAAAGHYVEDAVC
jgi:hypothetical protein